MEIVVCTNNIHFMRQRLDPNKWGVGSLTFCLDFFALHKVDNVIVLRSEKVKYSEGLLLRTTVGRKASITTRRGNGQQESICKDNNKFGNVYVV
jgi:hypothetical protein